MWWVGIVLAGSSLFAPGGRDLPGSAGVTHHPHAALLNPDVGQDALVDRVPDRVGEARVAGAPGRPVHARVPTLVTLAVALLVTAVVAGRSAPRVERRRVPSRRRRGPPRPAASPRARPALASAVAPA